MGTILKLVEPRTAAPRDCMRDEIAHLGPLFRNRRDVAKGQSAARWRCGRAGALVVPGEAERALVVAGKAERPLVASAVGQEGRRFGTSRCRQGPEATAPSRGEQPGKRG